MILSVGRNWVDFFRYYVGSFAKARCKSFEANCLIEQRGPSGVGKTPEIPRLVMQRPALVTGDKANCTLVKFSVELDGEAPWHEYVFEDGDRHRRIESHLAQQL